MVVRLREVSPLDRAQTRLFVTPFDTAELAPRPSFWLLALSRSSVLPFASTWPACLATGTFGNSVSVKVLMLRFSVVSSRCQPFAVNQLQVDIRQEEFPID